MNELCYNILKKSSADADATLLEEFMKIEIALIILLAVVMVLNVVNAIINIDLWTKILFFALALLNLFCCVLYFIMVFKKKKNKKNE